MRILVYGHRGWIGQQFIQMAERYNPMEVSNNRGAGAGGGAGRVVNDSDSSDSSDESDDENNERRARRRDTRRGARERRTRERDIHIIRGTARVDDEAAVRAEIRSSEATHVVSFIGRTHGVIGDVEYGTIDYLEQEGKLYENIRDNLFGPMVLAMVCKEMRVHFTYLGTGCIFEYDETHPLSEPITGRSEGVNMNTMVRGEGGGESTGFREGDRPNFFGSSYSVVKGFTDRLMHMFEDEVLQLRIRMPITGRRGPRNFITKIATYDRVCSIPNSMTVLPDLLPIALRMMRERKTGTYNFTNPGVISHNEILTMYREIVDEAFVWENFTVEEQGAVIASKRSNNYLDTGKLEREYPEVRPIHVAVRDMLREYAETFWDDEEGSAGGERTME